MFDHGFDEFFDAGPAEAFDIDAALEDLRTLLAMPRADRDATPEDARSRKRRAPSGGRSETGPPIPAVEERPEVELIDEQPLLLDVDDEQLGPWLDDVPPAEFDPEGPTYFSMGMVCRKREPMLARRACEIVFLDRQSIDAVSNIHGVGGNRGGHGRTEPVSAEPPRGLHRKAFR